MLHCKFYECLLYCFTNDNGSGRLSEFFIYNELVYFYEPAFTQRPTGYAINKPAIVKIHASMHSKIQLTLLRGI
ncbi:hypothetical protein D0V76_07815 [Salmonella enterica]|uniref:Uncharacterized protein n=10 Tax=Salmonella enterica TaxID=28901 RepID=A0A5V5CR31_SALER|nr:hypothetical protein [Salmonella enterica subsp. enterica serovar Pensacola]EAQ4575068.1 hypothetical protein [Salmonella enterica]EDQ0312518.1 hypothetical protein [Salmonella enterica subsp. enterica serovar Berta]EDV7396112.1 hypothetical protein [Salmonella enterica subsp. enterica]EAV2405328.1 hypothetical protein [Salmonella enterica]